ncbi:hypothetical protein CRV046 [Nile crocodilepox virus]|uniref:Uncharacterized protein n=1 Tax=Nile crocodilepox virus (isolate Crocodylus niloticus/Zimbabwe/Ume/2001) TaxID=1289473 RepID=Q070K5_CPRVZ|nr:hypothetical protein CRV046 [Nile crocodilepox virus]ABJ08937.1 hypothetical protein CRV046 [Nile crocodilepox virus]
MDVSTLEDIERLSPFNKSGYKRVSADCLCGNSCFVKLAEIKQMPRHAVTLRGANQECVHRNGLKFSLYEILYSAFYYNRSYYQYVRPAFVLGAARAAVRSGQRARAVHYPTGSYDLKLDLIFPTLQRRLHVIVGLRVKDYWRPVFVLESAAGDENADPNARDASPPVVASPETNTLVPLSQAPTTKKIVGRSSLRSRASTVGASPPARRRHESSP